MLYTMTKVGIFNKNLKQRSENASSAQHIAVSDKSSLNSIFIDNDQMVIPEKLSSQTAKVQFISHAMHHTL